MQDPDRKLAELEGRLIAHRQLLARILDGMEPDVRDAHLRWMADREILRDGQEDPGAVPTGAETLPLSTAEEFQEIAARIRNRLSRAT